MNIGGFQKVSLVDYPDKICSIVFTNGCSFKCGFCHNPELVIPPFRQNIPEEEFFAYLDMRGHLIDAVVITGGEPTLQPDLGKFIARVKSSGHLVKLDSNGYQPKTLAKLIFTGNIDYIAMDIKAPFEKYSEITGISINIEKIKQSISLIMDSGISHEFRTTLIAGFHEEDDIIEMARTIKGADAYYLQKFIPAVKLVDENFRSKKTLASSILEKNAKICERYVKVCRVRDSGI